MTEREEKAGHGVLLGLEVEAADAGGARLEWARLTDATSLLEHLPRLVVVALHVGEEVLLLEPRRLEPLRRDGGAVEELAAKHVARWWDDPARLVEQQQQWRIVLDLGTTLAGARNRRIALIQVQEALCALFPERDSLVLERRERVSWRPATGLAPVLGVMELPALAHMEQPGIWAVSSPPSIPAPWARLAAALESDRLVHVPVTTDVLVVVGLRARDRIRSGECPLLLSLAQIAGTALYGLGGYGGVDHPALKDPETGLATRLNVDVVMERYLASARRGEPLALGIVVPEGGPAEGREQMGSRSADPVLESGERIRGVVRDSDLVAGLDDGRLLLILPRCARPGALRVLHRIRGRLHGVIDFSAGVSEFGSEAATTDQLIRAASEALERSRRLQQAGGGGSGGG